MATKFEKGEEVFWADDDPRRPGVLYIRPCVVDLDCRYGNYKSNHVMIQCDGMQFAPEARKIFRRVVNE